MQTNNHKILSSSLMERVQTKLISISALPPALYPKNQDSRRKTSTKRQHPRTPRVSTGIQYCEHQRVSTEHQASTPTHPTRQHGDTVLRASASQLRAPSVNTHAPHASARGYSTASVSKSAPSTKRQRHMPLAILGYIHSRARVQHAPRTSRSLTAQIKTMGLIVNFSNKARGIPVCHSHTHPNRFHNLLRKTESIG